MGIDRVEYMKIDQGGNEGVQIIFTYDDQRFDTFRLFGEDKDAALPMLMAPGMPEVLMINLRSLLNITVH